MTSAGCGLASAEKMQGRGWPRAHSWKGLEETPAAGSGRRTAARCRGRGQRRVVGEDRPAAVGWGPEGARGRVEEEVGSASLGRTRLAGGCGWWVEEEEDQGGEVGAVKSSTGERRRRSGAGAGGASSGRTRPAGGEGSGLRWQSGRQQHHRGEGTVEWGRSQQPGQGRGRRRIIGEDVAGGWRRRRIATAKLGAAVSSGRGGGEVG